MTAIYLIFGALFGLSGIALAAAGAHVNGAANVQIAAQFLLFHAPAVIALVCARRLDLLMQRVSALAVALLILGVVLFCGDLAWRGFRGESLLPMAAPIGGGLMMVAWALVALSALRRRRK